MRARSLAVSLLVLAGACATHADGFAQWSWLGVEPSSEPESVSVYCSERAAGVRTALRADATGGVLTLRLLDPAGVERHRQVVRAGQCEIVQHWPGAVGVWTLRAEPDDFTGSYSIELSASRADEVRVELAGDLSR